MHAFTDGRDTLPHAGAGYLAELDRTAGRARRLGGRALLGDGSRPPLGSHAAGLRHARARPGAAPRRAAARRRCREAYERGETDEFIEPTLVGEEARIRPGDSVICFNFRPDRMRQLTRALAEPGFGGAGRREARRSCPGWSGRGGARADRAPTRRSPSTRRAGPTRSRFAPERPAATLSAVLARAGAAQLHVAETEKYAHVTYFFNGGEEAPLRGERRELVPSPRDVPTYDHKPQMSAREAAARVRGRLARGSADVRDHQLRERRHGRPHGRDRGGGEGGRDGRRVPRRGGRGGARDRRRVRRDRRPRQRRPHARAGRQPQHRALAEPGAADRDGAGAVAATAGRHPRGRRADRARAARHRAAAPR